MDVDCRHMGWDADAIRTFEFNDLRAYDWLLNHTTERVDGRPVVGTPNTE